MMETGELLRAYVQHHSEPAFRELVERYFDLVYSVALRRVDGDTLLAQDAAQVVFTDLARKAASLPPEVMLGGWLHRHACFVAGTLGRGEQRRRQRERLAVEMNTLNEPSDADWKQVAPLLDEAIGQLDAADHTAIVLRYFEGRDLRAVGAALGTNEDAAQKRVSRAVDKLHAMLAQRGVTLSVVGVGTILASKAVAAAPAGLAGSVAGAAFAAGGGATAGLAAAGIKAITPVGLKVLLGTTALVVLTGALLFHPWNPKRGPQPVPAAVTGIPALAAIASQPATNPPSAAPAASAETNGILHLVVVAADSGKPVPNVALKVLDLGPAAADVKEVSCNRMGICDVPYSRTVERLMIWASTDGFADTRLNWQPKDELPVPAAYTLRLTRPVAIGGSVVDADNQPVAGAQVLFCFARTNYGNFVYRQPEDHWFDVITNISDADGRWSINRIAPELLHQVCAIVSHPQHPAARLPSFIGNAEAEQQLREGAYVFKLERGLPFQGVVLDPAGQPVSEAELILFDRDAPGLRKTKTADDGTFALVGCKAGKRGLKIDAAGFAPTMVEADIQPDAAPLAITLQRSRDLRLRFADPAGNALAQRGAKVTLDYGPIDKAGRVYRLKTDTEGRALCTNAPVGELSLSATFFHGEKSLEGVKLQADGQEHLLTVAPGRPPIVIACTVKDLRSEQPIPNFRIFFGQFQAAQPDSPPELAWVMWLPCSGGQFNQNIPDNLPGVPPNGGDWKLRFEADGYAPFVSRVIRPDEGKVRLDVKLRPAAATTLSVLLPDGSLAAYADVAPVSPGALLQLVPGGFSREGMFSSGFLLQTDARANASVPPDEAITRVVVANAAGYGEATSEELAADPTIRLQPWGRLEGTLPTATQTVAGLTLFLDLEQEGLGAPDVHSFSAKADEQGRFVFPRVPPGKHKLMRLAAPGATPAAEPLADVEILPGQTTTLSLGGAGQG